MLGVGSLPWASSASAPALLTKRGRESALRPRPTRGAPRAATSSPSSKTHLSPADPHHWVSAGLARGPARLGTAGPHHVADRPAHRCTELNEQDRPRTSHAESPACKETQHPLLSSEDSWFTWLSRRKFSFCQHVRDLDITATEKPFLGRKHFRGCLKLQRCGGCLCELQTTTAGVTEAETSLSE